MKSFLKGSLCFIVLLCAHNIATALELNRLQGVVRGLNEDNELKPLVGASVRWMGGRVGALTNKTGEFFLERMQYDSIAVVSYVGYVTDTIRIGASDSTIEVELKSQRLQTVIVKGERSGTTVSAAAILPTEVMSKREFTKAACCTLAESFDSNPSVDVSYSDAVSGAKHIELLGLQGVYTQLLTECLPTTRGLGAGFGLDYIPGAWLENISISKGSASVVNGYESIAGQIDVELKRPDESEPLFLNVYSSMFGRFEVNATSARQLSETWSAMVLAHGSIMKTEIDNNGDGFMDMPMREQANVMGRWKYATDQTMVQFGVKALYEQRDGGQSHNTVHDDAMHPLYLIGIKTRRLEGFYKSGHILDDVERNHLAFFATTAIHEQQSAFGLRKYNGNEDNVNLRAVWTHKFGETATLVSGVSWLYDNYNERLDSTILTRRENVPGIFSEFTYKDIPNTTIMTALRYDKHNLFGDFVTPRFLVKYDVAEGSALRLTAGKGYRVANPIIENTPVLAGSRLLTLPETIKPEIAWNYGVSFVTAVTIAGEVFSIDMDFFRTVFDNQVILDMDFSPRQARIVNVESGSYSNSAQIRAIGNIFSNVEVTAAYKFQDIQMTTAGMLQQRALISPHKILLAADYSPEGWQFNATYVLHSSGRVPSTVTNPEQYRVAESFPTFSIVNMQATKKFGGFEVYIGAENLFNVRQLRPLTASENPFGEYFDSSLVWGPILGAMGYAGFRLSID